jgi:hypothetical protein
MRPLEHMREINNGWDSSLSFLRRGLGRGGHLMFDPYSTACAPPENEMLPRLSSSIPKRVEQSFHFFLDLRGIGKRLADFLAQ